MTQAYLGEIRSFGFNYPPRGWMQCSGQLLAIAQYNALFALLGTMYGGNGTTTFALPDLRGRVPLGYGQGPGLSPHVLGEQGGAENTPLLITNLPPHNHPLNAKAGGGDQGAPTGHLLAASDQRNSQYTSASADTTMVATAIGTTGGGIPINNMPPYLVSNYCIAISGVFPSRN